jgi:hypothetical protein
MLGQMHAFVFKSQKQTKKTDIILLINNVYVCYWIGGSGIGTGIGIGDWKKGDFYGDWGLGIGD